MADLATLSIKVDASGAVTTLDQLGTKLGQTEKQASSVTDALAKLGVAVSAGMIFKKFIDETSQAQFALAQLEARVKSTAGAAGQSVGQLAALAGEMQNLTAFSDEAVMSAEALLLTFTSIKGDIFPAALKATADLATAMGTDLNGAALQLGKALQDPETGLLALRRSGISFSQEQIKVIKALVDTGHEAQAQKMILAELAKETGGSAAAAANTFGGALAQLKNAFGELFEGTTNGTSALVQFIKAVTDGLKWLNEHQTVVKALAVTIGITLAAVAIPAAIGALAALSLAVRANTVAWLESPYAPLVIAITAVGAAFVYLNGAYAEHIAHAKSANLAHGDLKLTLYEEEGAAKRAAEATAKHEKALADEGEAVTKLVKNYDDKAAATRRELSYVKAHTEALVAQAVREIELAAAMDKVTDAAARKYAGMDRLSGMTAGKGAFAIADGFQGGALPGVNNDLAKQAAHTWFVIQEDTAQKAAQAVVDADAKAEKEKAAIREQFMKQFQQTVANGIANMLENGLGSWRSFFDSIKSMFLKLVADFAAAKIMDKILNNGQNAAGATSLGAMFGGDFGKGGGGTAMAGASVALTAGMIGYGVGGMTRNTTTGALAGGAAGAASGAAMGALLGPIGAGAGALIGGLAGLVTGFMGASAAAKKYAEDMVKQQNSLLAAAQAFVDRGLTGQAKIESEQNKLAKERDDLLNGLAANFKAGGFGKDGAANYQHTVEEIGFAYDRQKKALEATTKAAEDYSLVLKVAAEFEETNYVRSLRARELRAAGATQEADALDLFNRQVAEFADAVKKGYDETTLARLAYVQSLEVERTAYRTNLSAQITAANATRMSAMAAENLASGLGEISPAWQKVIDALAKSRDAAEQTANAIRKTVDATRSLFENLAGYTKSLLVGGLSPLTKSQQVAEARSQFEDASRKAAFGDLAAGGKVTGLATQFLTLIKETSQASAQAAQDAAQAALPKYFRTAMPAVEGTQTAEYQQAFADVSAMIDAATLGVGGQLDIQVQQLRQAELQTAILNRMLAQSSAAARGLPFFASGGEHSGGIALVGERGPELINTGRARIFSAADSAAAFAGNSTATVEELRRVIARLETLVRVTAAGAQETVKAVARVSSDVASLTREVRLSGEAAA